MRTIPILILSLCLMLSACGDDSDSSARGTGENDAGENDTGLGGSNTINLTWSAPTENVDLSCTDDLSGFEIHYRNNSGQYSDSMLLSVDEASCVDSTNITSCGITQVCSYTLTGLPTDTWNIAVSAYDNGGNQSLHSNEIIRVVSN